MNDNILTNVESLEKDYLGIVIDNKDPEFLGRCKIRVFEKYDNIPDESLPWALPGNSLVFSGGGGGFGSFSAPKKNHFVRVKFENGDIYRPIYFTIEKINESLRNEIKQSYENCQILVYDEDEKLKILYTKNKGLLIFLKDKFINISNEGKIIEVSDEHLIKTNKHYIESSNVMIGKDASHPDTKCDELINILLKLANMIDTKYPPTPGVAVGEISQAFNKICSKIVKIAD